MDISQTFNFAIVISRTFIFANPENLPPIDDSAKINGSPSGVVICAPSWPALKFPPHTKNGDAATVLSVVPPQARVPHCTSSATGLR